VSHGREDEDLDFLDRRIAFIINGTSDLLAIHAGHLHIEQHDMVGIAGRDGALRRLSIHFAPLETASTAGNQEPLTFFVSTMRLV